MISTYQYQSSYDGPYDDYDYYYDDYDGYQTNMYRTSELTYQGYPCNYEEKLSTLFSQIDIDDSSRDIFNEKAHLVKAEQKLDLETKRTFSQKGVYVCLHEDGFRLKIYFTDLKKQLPIMKKGDVIDLTLPRWDKSMRIFFDELKDDCFIFAMSNYSLQLARKFNLRDHAMKFNLEISHNAKMFERKIKACEQIVMNPDWLESLTLNQVPSRSKYFKPLLEVPNLTASNLVCFNTQLNKKQREAIVNILRADNRPHPYILFGPPGTGKTATLAEVIIQIFNRSKRAQILVCGNSNACADLLATKLAEYDIIRRARKPTMHLVRLVAESRAHVNDARANIIRRYTKTSREFADLEKTPRIIVATCNKASSLREGMLKRKGSNLKFDFVIIDEAGHAQEPDALIPVTLLKNNGSIVLGGDPHQLSPVTKLKDAHSLSESILDRIFKLPIYQKRLLSKTSKIKIYDESYITKLIQCHRSDKRVIRVNNMLFYENELVSSFKTPQKLLKLFKTTDPLLFDATAGREILNDNTFSNKMQASRCLQYVKLAYSGGLKPDDVGIITPYRGQLTMLSSLFDGSKLKRCKVATIDEFQGEERMVIIISTVRSKKIGSKCKNSDQRSLGFLRDYKRFNVAISRARGIVIVIGNRDILNMDINWSTYIYNASPSKI